MGHNIFEKCNFSHIWLLPFSPGMHKFSFGKYYWKSQFVKIENSCKIWAFSECHQDVTQCWTMSKKWHRYSWSVILLIWWHNTWFILKLFHYEVSMRTIFGSSIFPYFLIIELSFTEVLNFSQKVIRFILSQKSLDWLIKSWRWPRTSSSSLKKILSCHIHTVYIWKINYFCSISQQHTCYIRDQAKKSFLTFPWYVLVEAEWDLVIEDYA